MVPRRAAPVKPPLLRSPKSYSRGRSPHQGLRRQLLQATKGRSFRIGLALGRKWLVQPKNTIPPRNRQALDQQPRPPATTALFRPPRPDRRRPNRDAIGSAGARRGCATAGRDCRTGGAASRGARGRRAYAEEPRVHHGRLEWSRAFTMSVQPGLARRAHSRRFVGGPGGRLFRCPFDRLPRRLPNAHRLRPRVPRLVNPKAPAAWQH